MLEGLNVAAGTGYHSRILEQVSAYNLPLGAASAEALQHAFFDLAGAAEDDPKIRIESRDLRCIRRAGGVVWFDFATFCGTARSQKDYLELSNRFNTVTWSHLSKMSAYLP